MAHTRHTHAAHTIVTYPFVNQILESFLLTLEQNFHRIGWVSQWHSIPSSPHKATIYLPKPCLQLARSTFLNAGRVAVIRA